MDIVSITMANAQGGGLQPAMQSADARDADTPKTAHNDKSAEAARQFEAIMVRQLLEEPLKSLTGGESGGQVYGYLVTSSLADVMTKAGGLGLTHILQAQLKQ